VLGANTTSILAQLLGINSQSQDNLIQENPLEITPTTNINDLNVTEVGLIEIQPGISADSFCPTCLSASTSFFAVGPGYGRKYH